MTTRAQMTERLARTTRLTRDGASTATIARVLGVSTRVVTRYRAKAGAAGRLTYDPATIEARRAVVAAKYPAGVTVAQLAYEHDVSTGAIRRDLRRLGVKPRTPGGWT